MKSKLTLTLAAFAFSASMAFGAITATDLATQYQTDGYSYITIKSGVTQIKVTAVKDGQRVETVYDIATGTAVKTSSHSVGTIVSPDPGVTIRDVGRDFVRSGKRSDDDANDDSNDDNDDNGNDDNGMDDDHGKHRSGSHDDDHGDDHNDDHKKSSKKEKKDKDHDDD